MKKLLNSGILILIAVMLVYILFLHECRGKNYWIPEKMILVKQTTWDSLINRKMDTTINKVVDTFIIKEPVYIEIDTGSYTVITPDTRHYEDSTVNDSIRFWQDIYIQGIVQKWNKRYEPVIHTITNETTITQQVPVDRPIYITDNGLYISGMGGGNKDAFTFGGNIDLITKKDFLYGAGYQRFGNENFFLIRFGAKIRFKHNK